MTISNQISSILETILQGNDLEKIIKFWNISEELLFTKTRKIWSNDFKPSNAPKDLIGSGFDTSN